LFFIDGSGLEKFWNKIKTVYILYNNNIQDKIKFK